MLQQPALHRQQPGARLSLHQGSAHGRPHPGALRVERLGTVSPARLIRIVRGHRRQRFAAQHIPVARRSERIDQRAQAAHQVVRQHAHAAKQPQRRAQAPQRHPRLMHVLDVFGVQHARQIGLELREAGLDDRGKAVLHADAVLEHQRHRLDRRIRHAVRQAHAALGLADVERQAVERPRPLQRQREQRIRLACFQLELDLADRLAGFARNHLADIQRHLDLRAAPAFQQPGGAPEARLEHRPHPLAQGLRHIRPRLVRKPRPVQRAARDRHFELDPARQATLPLALGLQRLQPAPPRPPHPQRHAHCAQGKVRGVEIPGDEVHLHRRAAPPGHPLEEGVGLSRRQRELEFDFLRMRSCHLSVILELRRPLIIQARHGY